MLVGYALCVAFMKSFYFAIGTSLELIRHCEQIKHVYGPMLLNNDNSNGQWTTPFVFLYREVEEIKSWLLTNINNNRAGLVQMHESFIILAVVLRSLTRHHFHMIRETVLEFIGVFASTKSVSDRYVDLFVKCSFGKASNFANIDWETAKMPCVCNLDFHWQGPMTMMIILHQNNVDILLPNKSEWDLARSEKSSIKLSAGIFRKENLRSPTEGNCSVFRRKRLILVADKNDCVRRWCGSFCWYTVL